MEGHQKISVVLNLNSLESLTWHISLLSVFSESTQHRVPQDWLRSFYRSYGIKFCLTLALLCATLTVSFGHAVILLTACAVAYVLTVYLYSLIL